MNAVIHRYLTNAAHNIGKQKDLKDMPKFRNKEIRSASQFREILVSTAKPTPCSINFWKRKLDYEIKESDWQMSFNATREIRLRVLQWKILHNIYPTNIKNNANF